MKGLVLCAVVLGILLVMSTPSLAHEYWHGYYPPVHHHPHYHYAPAPIIVSGVPVYGYAAYPPAVPVVAPGYPVVVPAPPVVGAPYYYGPGVTLGVRTRGVAVGVGF